jgi:hypothetical protein
MGSRFLVTYFYISLRMFHCEDSRKPEGIDNDCKLPVFNSVCRQLNYIGRKRNNVGQNTGIDVYFNAGKADGVGAGT